MKTFVCSLAFLGIVVVSGGGFARAADPPPTLRKGKVLILRNEYTIEGDIERVGDRYCVRRKVGETWIPAERVLALTASLEDAYAYLHKIINLDDADERLRLARWCRTSGLMQQALTELQAAASLRPDHAETRRLLQYWKQAAAKGEPPAQSNAKSTSAATPPATDAARSAAVRTPPIEVTTDSLGMFATRVQPILMNTCARCHVAGRGGNFHLSQVYEDDSSNRQALERNLAAVLAEINVHQPEASPLLIKALSDHAHTGQAPLRNRQAAPFRTLESWVKMTLAGNPYLGERSQPAGASVHPVAMTPDPVWSVESRAKGQDESEWGADARSRAAASPSPIARGEKPPTAPDSSAMPAKGETGKPAPANPAADPYDPEPFNRKTHPEASKSEPGK